jgi:hypothetical protein
MKTDTESLAQKCAIEIEIARLTSELEEVNGWRDQVSDPPTDPSKLLDHRTVAVVDEAKGRVERFGW